MASAPGDPPACDLAACAESGTRQVRLLSVLARSAVNFHPASLLWLLAGEDVKQRRQDLDRSLGSTVLRSPTSRQRPSTCARLGQLTVAGTVTRTPWRSAPLA